MIKTKEKITYILFSVLILSAFSCKNANTNNVYAVKPSKGESEIQYTKQPERTVFRNLEVDTTKIFGLWSQDPTAPFADFHISATSFNVVDPDGGGLNPYSLEKNKITVFHKGLKHKGTITYSVNDTLKIKWTDSDFEMLYVRVGN
ncbi:hypothetical protein [Mangrovimonas sp. DI 80]|uniref:hypothetical protein n=1 Tax=Mangrovimonas sp. DI 80 TaxID=1779330 RepID=UPI0009765FAE|nr:hypothetical protein [Mangrovimonas sp. DI 80]OMP30111.1 hypothetical protein BKM32_12020 [Mangrovimonas sp. DI 80]